MYNFGMYFIHKENTLAGSNKKVVHPHLDSVQSTQYEAYPISWFCFNQMCWSL